MHPDSSHNIKGLLRLNNSFKIHQERVSCCILIDLKMLIFTRPIKKNHKITHSINTAFLYISDGVKGLYTISDVKSHTASGTWASLAAMFKQIDLADTQRLYIASDSPLIQYRNKKNLFFSKQWAVSNKIEICWIFTETDHGKGPMDGLGGAMKATIKDTIA